GTDPPRLSNLGRRLRQTLAWRLRLHYPGRSHRTTFRGARSLRSQAIFLQAYREHLEVQHQSEFVTLARRYAQRNGIGDYLVFGLNQDLSSTTFREIQRLPPAHSLTLHNGALSIRRYWTPDTSKEIRYRDRDSYVERFNELLKRAVRDRLSDRVAVSMSGGLDSTSLAAVACDLGADVHACAVVYD